MFVPGAIDFDFVPYTKRSRLRRNAGLFVDGARGGSGGSRVVPQNWQCHGRQDEGKPCGPNNAGRCTAWSTCDYPSGFAAARAGVVDPFRGGDPFRV
jgi:hypothetical protein